MRKLSLIAVAASAPVTANDDAACCRRHDPLLPRRQRPVGRRLKKNLALPGLIPGITVNTSPDDYRLITSLRPERFDGERWIPMSGAMAAQ